MKERASGAWAGLSGSYVKFLLVYQMGEIR